MQLRREMSPDILTSKRSEEDCPTGRLAFPGTQHTSLLAELYWDRCTMLGRRRQT